jgi:cytochrome c biogenesis DsbD-like protein
MKWVWIVVAVALQAAPDPFAPKETRAVKGATAVGPLATTDTAHLLLTAELSEKELAPGKQFSISYDIAPHRGMHVYAPGKHPYQVISVELDPQEWMKAMPVKFPPSEIYHFKPTDERVEVYTKPFRLVQDVTILATPAVQKMLAKEKTLTITARVKYQACDDALCYAPASVPVKWTVPLRQLHKDAKGTKSTRKHESRF